MSRDRRFRKPSLSQQLLTGFGLSIMTIGLATLWVNYRLIRADLERQIQQRAEAITQGLEFSSEGLLEVQNISILRRIAQNYATLPAVLEVAIVSPEGETLAYGPSRIGNPSFQAAHPNLQAVIETASVSGVATHQKILLNNKPVFVEVLPFSHAIFGPSGRRGLAIAILDMEEMQQEVGRTFLASTVTLLVGALLILLLMWLLLRRQILQPLAVLTAALNRSKETGRFSMPTALPANEIQFLAATFDAAFRQLESYDRLQAEIAQRQKVEEGLRDSEARERSKSQALEQALQELRQTQLHLVQSEKMSSLGQLVAGVAHEINNPVNFIYGNLDHAERYAQDLLHLIQVYQQHYPTPAAEIEAEAEEIDLDFLVEDLPKLLASMKVGADRIKSIVASLRTFSRLDEAEVKAVNIHEGIDSTLMILQNRLKPRSDHPGIDVIKTYGELPLVECYAGQLNQVFMNILTNAADALDEANQHRTPEEIQANPSRITICTQVAEPGWVLIQISDNGPGIPEAVRAKLFDPFFTTKPVGRGTGLGLSISQEIVVSKHGGKLWCDSTLGQGTTFGIEIPVQQPEGDRSLSRDKTLSNASSLGAE